MAPLFSLELISMAESLYEALDKVFGKEEEDDSGLPELGDDEWSDFMTNLSSFVEMYDIDDLKMMLEMLKEYRLPEEKKSIYLELRNAAKGPDWGKLAELVAM